MHKFFILIHLLHSSTCVEHYCAHLQEDNCINTASGIVTLFGWLFGTQVANTNLHQYKSIPFVTSLIAWRPVVNICTTRLHTAHLCVLCGSYNNPWWRPFNRLVFIKEVQCVLCAVWNSTLDRMLCASLNWNCTDSSLPQNVQTGCGARPIRHSGGTADFYRGSGGRSLNLTTKFHLVLTLRMSGAIRLNDVGRNGFIPVLLHTGSSKKMDGILNRCNLKSTR